MSKGLRNEVCPRAPGHSIFPLGDHVFSESNTLNRKPDSHFCNFKKPRNGALKRPRFNAIPCCQMSYFFLSLLFIFIIFRNSSLSIAEEFPTFTATVLTGNCIFLRRWLLFLWGQDCQWEHISGDRLMEEKAKGPIVQGLGTMNLSQREQNGISVHPAMSTHYFFPLSFLNG